MQARHLLTLLAVLQLVSVCMNWFSSILLLMLPVSLLAVATVFIAIYYKWKRGLELFIFLCLILSIMMLVPFTAIFVNGTQGEKWLDVTWYVLGMLINALCVVAAWWVLYQTDYSAPDVKERKSLLGRMGSDLGGKWVKKSLSEDR
mmetsp:Transcript_18789/g.36554  ORF Transcript_18789/g.36554 Transcript_18789/m.36554 type:complete len:146 (-) Transcript_18789:120-557(-)